jgi:membrane-anchored glycerophosphoryl diester phosphodiesterase (GDPDase)
VLLVVCGGILGMMIGIGVLVVLRLEHIVSVALLIGMVTLAIVAAVIYGSVRVQFWLTALIDQDLSGPRSIGRSWRLTRGHWWRITGILFVAGVVIWVLSIVFGLVAALVGGVFAASGGAATLLHHLRLVVMISSLSRLVTLPLLSAVWIAIYRDLMLRHEGSDLAARAEALGGS